MNIASMIDHTLLKSTATAEQIRKICAEARTYQFASVCIQPYWIPLVKRELDNTKVAVCTVIGFPLGVNTKEVKVYETIQAIENGATEIDTVINQGAVKSGDYKVVEEDIKGVVSAAQGALVKVILETGSLTESEIVSACQMSLAAGAHFVKTSTGFGSGGATVEAVQLMRKTVGNTMGVKASGGVRDLETAEAMVAAGATRLGTSSGVAIIQGREGKTGY